MPAKTKTVNKASPTVNDYSRRSVFFKFYPLIRYILVLHQTTHLSLSVNRSQVYSRRSRVYSRRSMFTVGGAELTAVGAMLTVGGACLQ